MTTQLLISIEHLFELNAQHVQRVSAPFIDFTVIFVIYLFQTKKQNTSMQSTKRSVSKKAVVEVKLLLSSPLSCLLIIKKKVFLHQITAKYTVDIQTIVFHLRTRGWKGVVPACMPAKTPMQQMSPIFILCVWIIAVHHAVWRVSHSPVWSQCPIPEPLSRFEPHK